MSGEETSELQQRTMKRVAARLMPALLILYIIAYLDRVNVTFAQDKLESDLGFSGAVYGFGAGVFFIAYFFLEVPSNLALHKFGARKWIARIMLTWGIISACTALVQGPASFYLVRFLLGAAEAGFFPGMILYLSYWFPARERARAVGFFMSAIAISYAIGAPISGGIMSVFGGVGGLEDWQWLFLIEAIPALIAGVFVLRVDGRRPRARQVAAATTRSAGWPSGSRARRRCGSRASGTPSARRSRTRACSCSARSTSAWSSTSTASRSGSARSSTRSAG